MNKTNKVKNLIYLLKLIKLIVNVYKKPDSDIKTEKE